MRARKKSLSKSARISRAALAMLDPRAWLHWLRMVNYYNYAHVIPRRALQVGRDAHISPDAVFSNAGNIVLGDGVRIGSRCHLWAGMAGGTIVVGDDALFGPEVMVTAASYCYDEGAPVSDQPMKEAPIIIGKDVWLATRAIVLPGAQIGDGAIVAAGSLVRGVIPAMAIVAGSPARVVGQRQAAFGRGADRPPAHRNRPSNCLD